MIPQNITKEHVKQAIQEIDSTIKEIPPHRESHNYDVIFEGKQYPPKYVISLANKYANGSELPSYEFTAIEAKTFLPKLGFEVKLKFDIKPGDIIGNQQIMTLFKCGNKGGMRRSKETNTLVIISDQTISDQTKPFYKDEWKGDILHYTGMGMTGDQKVDYMQNKTLAESKTNGVDVHLFEVYSPGKYTYKGMVELAGQPEEKLQKDKDGVERKVVIFPLRLIDPDYPISDSIIFAKIGWSENGWQGFDQNSANNKESSGYRFVREQGIANEWWNFYDYGDEYYYGRIRINGDPSHFEENGLVLFASKNNVANTLCFIGFYGCTEYGSFPLPINSLDTIQDSEIKERHRDKYSELSIASWRAKKEISDRLFEPIEFDLNEINLTQWGQAAFMYVGEKDKISKESVQQLLEKTISHHESLLSVSSETDRITIQTTIDKTKKILSLYFSTPSIPEEDDPAPTWSTVAPSLACSFTCTEIPFAGLHFPDAEKRRISSDILAALRSGKHIILTGPPGTGKSKIAQAVCAAIAGPDNYEMCTASSDWSVYETIGGYRPKQDGTLQFHPGIFLRSFRRGNEPVNRWLIVDEINRADIDKAFGPLFSALAGDSVALPFEIDDEPVCLVGRPEEKTPLKPCSFIIHPDWRIIATMNTFDKSSLYEMSYAFMRRFAFIMVDSPKTVDAEQVGKYARAWGFDPDEERCRKIADLWNLVNRHRKIGPALFRDIYHYFDTAPDAEMESAVAMYLFPQLEGLPEETQKAFINELLDLESIVDKDRLKQNATMFFHITLKGSP